MRASIWYFAFRAYLDQALYKYYFTLHYIASLSTVALLVVHEQKLHSTGLLNYHVIL